MHSFYGDHAPFVGKRQKRIQEHMQSRADKRMYRLFEDRLFYKQRQAFMCCDALNERDGAQNANMCFASETGTAGKRKYLALSIGEFWSIYSRMREKDKHWYEVLREGMAVNLYLDLEFSVDVHAEKKSESENRWMARGHGMTHFLKKCLYECLSTICPVWCIVDLDATSPKKFSRHLIVRLSDHVAFPDSVSCGVFMNHVFLPFVEKAYTKRKSKSVDLDLEFDLRTLLEFVDKGVYTKNRNFRLYQSAKMGKSSGVLRLASDCDMVFGDAEMVEICPASIKRSISAMMHEERIFYASLACCTRADKLLTFAECGMKVVPKDLYEYDMDKTMSTTGIVRTERTERTERSVRSNFSSNEGPECLLLNDFVASSLLGRGGVQGYVTRCFWRGCTVVYNIGGNRFCERIGRFHKSNHGSVVVDIRDAVYWYTCFDPDCQRARKSGAFSPQKFKLPKGLIPQHVCDYVICLLGW